MKEDHSPIVIMKVEIISIISLIIGVIVDIILLKLTPQYTGVLIIWMGVLLILIVYSVAIVYYGEIFDDNRKVNQ